MGSRSSSQAKQSDGSGSPKGQSPKQSPRSSRSNSATSLLRGSLAAKGLIGGTGLVSPELAHGIAAAAGASPAQKEFLDTWFRAVYKEAEPQLLPQDTSLTLCTDLAYLEISITGGVGIMTDLASHFLAHVGISETRMIIQMRNVLMETKTESLTLWCRLKHLGGSPPGSSPGADAGFSMAAQLEWIIADILMPPLQEQELFREHAEEELLKPCMYRSSIFPMEPERALSLEMKGTPRKALLTALFFFKTLGFTKPEDATVAVLSNCPANRCSIHVFMGPRGITRCALRLDGPRQVVAEDLSGTCLGCRYNEEVLQTVGRFLGNAPDFVDYVAEPRGYTVAVGYST